MRKIVMLTAALFATPASSWPQEGEPALNARESITLTVLFDNFWTDDRLQSGWGFSALVETPSQTILFDTGVDGDILLENLRLMDKDPMAIDAVVISHAHGDHTAGLEALLDLGMRPRLYLLDGFPEQLRRETAASADVILASPGEEIAPGVLSTGQVDGPTPEQALVLMTENGPVFLTGCAHPGIVEMATRAREVAGGAPHTVLGGFHLASADGATLQRIVAEFRRLGVEVAGPTHCSGLMAMAVFQSEYGESFQRMGVGRVLRFTLSPRQVGPRP